MNEFLGRAGFQTALKEHMRPDQSIKTESVITKTLYLQECKVNPVQSWLLQHIYTCTTISANVGQASQTKYLEMPTDALLHFVLSLS